MHFEKGIGNMGHFEKKIENVGHFVEKGGKSALIVGSLTGQPELAGIGAVGVGVGKLTSLVGSGIGDVKKTSKLLKKR
jgi:hypothetical protein